MIKQIFITLLFFVLFSAVLFGQNTTQNSSEDSAKDQTDSKIEVPPDFKSDGCTMFPDGNYRDCCVAHDKDYYKGGSCKERRKSDDRLFTCVRKKKGWNNKIIAPIMWLGVRVLGTSVLPTDFRWGFGKDRLKKKKKVKIKKVKVKIKKVKVSDT